MRQSARPHRLVHIADRNSTYVQLTPVERSQDQCGTTCQRDVPLEPLDDGTMFSVSHSRLQRAATPLPVCRGRPPSVVHCTSGGSGGCLDHNSRHASRAMPSPRSRSRGVFPILIARNQLKICTAISFQGSRECHFIFDTKVLRPPGCGSREFDFVVFRIPESFPRSRIRFQVGNPTKNARILSTFWLSSIFQRNFKVGSLGRLSL